MKGGINGYIPDLTDGHSNAMSSKKDVNPPNLYPFCIRFSPQNTAFHRNQPLIALCAQMGRIPYRMLFPADFDGGEGGN